MKAAHYALVAGLFYAALGLALPFQLVLTSDTPTIRFKDSGQPQPRVSEPAHHARPTFLQYIERMRSDLHSISNAPGLERGSPENRLGHSPPDSAHDRAFRDHYGTIFGKLGWSSSSKDSLQDTPTKAQPVHHNDCHPTTQTVTYIKPADLLDIVDQHGPECVALAIFVLVPIAYFFLELLELAIGYCVHERYPQRGRDRVRLLGPERQLRAWSNRQREQLVESEKHWWQMRRHRH
ncbi:uncharacterized protein N7482_009649 [Penicillium canariense]|uniref:Uncharacterized protein n=1 Tax=Penicillium canariense TaxID=189055 RepID=A0A9W9LF46_9EURO|nr:uncharacterized protein N7482_009649 [Penicillium canariense]KAJ5153171.1 hypothetical protein N7482_009649 [Penicillium canariense]